MPRRNSPITCGVCRKVELDRNIHHLSVSRTEPRPNAAIKRGVSAFRLPRRRLLLQPAKNTGRGAPTLKGELRRQVILGSHAPEKHYAGQAGRRSVQSRIGRTGFFAAST